MVVLKDLPRRLSLVAFLLITAGSARHMNKVPNSYPHYQYAQHHLLSKPPDFQQRKLKGPFSPWCMVRRIRGGATSLGENDSAEGEEQGGPVRITVLTIAGSPHLDLKTRLDVPLTANVSTVKTMVQERMSGHPPAAVQRLIFGSRVLGDDEILNSIVRPRERDIFDDDDEDDDEDITPLGPQQLTLVLDILPPLPVDKSLPAALEAKLKAYAAEVVAVRHLANELIAGVLDKERSSSNKPAFAEEDDSTEEENEVMLTDGLRDQIKAMEEHVLRRVAHNITERKTKIHSAVAEDGRVASLSRGTPEQGPVGPWRQFQRVARHHADVEWKGTLRAVITCFLLAKFGAHGPTEEVIIYCASIGLVVWQMRIVRLALKIVLALASEYRGGPLVDLLSTLLPTSHQALLEAEDEAKLVDASFW